ncbi:ATP-binding protein, partial [Mycobacterium marinum]
MTRRYILTGTPGAGKTSIVRRLAELGHAVVAEAATDVILGRQARGEDEPRAPALLISRLV